MGLPLFALQMLRPHLNGAKVLSLSYPDITIPEGVLNREFGIQCTTFSNAGMKHGLAFRVPESMEVFRALGATLECTDVVRNTGLEIIADLNYPFDFGKYDVVLDPGTIEHCFNVGQAFVNAAQAVKSGGVIMHISPMNMMNHGFYNFSPTLFKDFYDQNGWEILDMAVVNERPLAFSTDKRFYATTEYCIYCLARRKGERPMLYPIQHKYRKNIEEKRAAA